MPKLVRVDDPDDSTITLGQASCLPEFYLGTHRTYWSTWATEDRDGDINAMPPLFISRRQLEVAGKTWTPPTSEVSIDSGGFTELKLFGRWTVSLAEYAEFCCRVHEWAGKRLGFIAPQDWMCEPFVISGKDAPRPADRFVGTKLSVAEHQRLTVENLVELRRALPDATAAKVAPVLQGWHISDYFRIVDAYAEAGVDLWREPVVGVGSICREGDPMVVVEILDELSKLGLRLHAFGAEDGIIGHLLRDGGLYREVKPSVIEPYGVVSFDSLAWSFAGRRRQLRLEDCTHAGDCRNCPRWAITWRDNLLMKAARKVAA